MPGAIIMIATVVSLETHSIATANGGRWSGELSTSGHSGNKTLRNYIRIGLMTPIYVVLATWFTRFNRPPERCQNRPELACGKVSRVKV